METVASAPVSVRILTLKLRSNRESIASGYFVCDEAVADIRLLGKKVFQVPEDVCRVGEAISTDDQIVIDIILLGMWHDHAQTIRLRRLKTTRLLKLLKALKGIIFKVMVVVAAATLFTPGELLPDFAIRPIFKPARRRA